MSRIMTTPVCAIYEQQSLISVPCILPTDAANRIKRLKVPSAVEQSVFYLIWSHGYGRHILSWRDSKRRTGHTCAVYSLIQSTSNLSIASNFVIMHHANVQENYEFEVMEWWSSPKKKKQKKKQQQQRNPATVKFFSNFELYWLPHMYCFISEVCIKLLLVFNHMYIQA